MILAAGRSERFGADKLSLDLDGRPIWRWAFDCYLSHPRIDGVGIVTSSELVQRIGALAPEALFVIAGGDKRQESSHIGATACPEDSVVLVADAARPFTDQQTISRVIDAIEEVGAAAAAVPVVDTLRDRTSGNVVNRDDLVAMQTPQGASREVLLGACTAASAVFTDDAELLRHFGQDVKLVQGSSANFKITTPSDYQRALGRMRQMEIRTGIGYDVHRFSEESGRVLMLGGVAFPGARALDGHSDADVVLHALTDALLGAAAMGDIGKHFPNTDPAWKNCASSKFLAAARDLLTAENFQIVNVDTTLIGEEPKVMPREKEIRCHIAETLGIEVGRVGFKATTNEGLGAIGRSEGIACFATAALKRG